MFDNSGSGSGEVFAHAPHVFSVRIGENPITPSEVDRLYKSRRARGRYFPDRLFADPAWDILLHLYATELGGQRSTVSGVVRASNVPEATALRWLAQLLDLGLCHKRPDVTDRRRLFVSLTAAGMQAMDNYFAEIRAGEPDKGFAQAA
jgi:DNA-binding MarR family transcriptional regulator